MDEPVATEVDLMPRASELPVVESPARWARPPVVLAVLPQLIPSTVLGVVKPLLALHREERIELDVTLEAWVGRRQLEAADLVVFCRNTEPRYAGVLAAVRQLGTPFIYELDDDFFAIPAHTPGAEYHRDPGRLAQLEGYLRGAALVRVYSEALRARVAALNPRVHRVDAAVDWDLVPATPIAPARGPLKIVYATSRLMDPIAELFTADLGGVLDAYRGRVEAWFWGHRPAALARRPDVHFVAFVQNYDRFFRRFARAGFDIGLAPLPDDEFHRAKSDNKFREYAASRIAGIYADMAVYRDCVDDGRTGLLVRPGPGGWFAAMARLIEDGALRARIRDEAWAYARGRYGVAPAARGWLAQIALVLPAVPAPPTRMPPRLPDAVSGVGGHRAPWSRVWPVARRALDVLLRRPGPAMLALHARVTWHLRSLRALWRLRRELARANVARSGHARANARPTSGSG